MQAERRQEKKKRGRRREKAGSRSSSAAKISPSWIEWERRLALSLTDAIPPSQYSLQRQQSERISRTHSFTQKQRDRGSRLVRGTASEQASDRKARDRQEGRRRREEESPGSSHFLSCLSSLAHTMRCNGGKGREAESSERLGSKTVSLLPL